MASWETYLCLLLRQICQHSLLLVGFFLDVFNKGIRAERSPDSRWEKVKCWARWSHYVFKEKRCLQWQVSLNLSVYLEVCFLSLSFLEPPEAGLVLAFIEVMGVVCGRNCSCLWLLHENCGVTSCLGLVRGILVRNMHSFREFKIVQSLQIEFTVEFR